MTLSSFILFKVIQPGRCQLQAGFASQNWIPGSVTDASDPCWNHLLQGLCSRVPHLMDREVLALLEGLPTLITDIVPYLCHGKHETVTHSAQLLDCAPHTQLPTLPQESEPLPASRLQQNSLFHVHGHMGSAVPCPQSLSTSKQGARVCVPCQLLDTPVWMSLTHLCG